MSEALLLECVNVSRAFVVRGRRIPVIADASFSLGVGECCAVSGRSGAGKSTLLAILAGLDAPDAGEIRFDGRSLAEMDNEGLALMRRREMGIVFQSFNLLPTWTARENVEAPLLCGALSPRRRRERAEELLAAFGLAGRAENLPAELSVGQQQRVAVCRALANDPRLIVADEPTGDVDPETGAEIAAALLGPVRAGTAALLVATHGAFPADAADRRLVLRDGVVRPETPVPKRG